MLGSRLYSPPHSSKPGIWLMLILICRLLIKGVLLFMVTNLNLLCMIRLTLSLADLEMRKSVLRDAAIKYSLSSELPRM
jgi:hypothetical protein